MDHAVKIAARDLTVDFRVPAGAIESHSEDGANARFQQVGNRTVLRALDRLSFEIMPGERVGIWGPNGSGKTTLLRALRGVYSPSDGELVVEGKTQSFLNLTFGLNEDATGWENILLRGVLMGERPGSIRAKMPKIAEFSELGEFLNMPLRSYSAGMRMRLALSVAMELPSDILLMDEWLSVGDASFRQKAAARMREAVEASKILIIASHNRKLIEGLCTRILTLDQGRIVSDQAVSGETKPANTKHRVKAGARRVKNKSS